MFEESNGFNIPKIKSLKNALYPLSIAGMILWVLALVLRSPALTIPVLLLNLIGIIIWVILWKELHKSTESLVTHGIFACIFGIGLNLISFLFLVIATSQARTVIENNGNVDVTFFNVKPRK